MKRIIIVLMFLCGIAQAQVVGGFVPTSRVLTINGVAQNLTTNRSWTITPASLGSWATTGNALGNNTSFLGTIDTNSIIFKTNNLQRFRISGNGFAEITRTTTPSQLVFSSNSTNVKSAVGLIGSPEANLTFNMDYSTKQHRYYDTTISALWFTMGANFFGLQYVPAGYGNTTSPSDMWSRSGNTIPFWTEPSTGNTKINGTLKIGSLLKGQNTTTTTAIYAKDMTTPNGIDYVTVPTNTTGDVKGFSQNISANTSGTVYGNIVTLANSGSGAIYANYAAAGKNYFGGNVGIGIITPTDVLSVVGGAQITGTTTFGGTSVFGNTTTAITSLGSIALGTGGVNGSLTYGGTNFKMLAGSSFPDLTLANNANSNGRFTIKNGTGNILIGDVASITDDATNEFQVYGGASAQTLLIKHTAPVINLNTTSASNSIINFNNIGATITYASISANASSGEIKYFARSGGYFPTFYSEGAEAARFNSTQDFVIGATTASARLHIMKTTEQLRVGYNSTNYLSTTVNSTGNVTFGLTGTTPKFTFSQGVILNGISDAAKTVNTTSGDAATINANCGRFRKDNSGTDFTLTNSFITANSIITLQNTTAGLTGGKHLTVQAGAGTATITFEDETTGIATAPSGNMDINFIIIN